MAVEGNRKNRMVWQDVIPAKIPQKNIKKTSKIKSALLALLKFTFYKKIVSKLSNISRKRLIVSMLFCTIILASLAGYFFLIKHAQPSQLVTPKTTGATPTLTKGTPEYTTVLPANKNIGELGGWTRVSPPDRNPVFAYIDKIGTNTINVSEQPLPDGFKEDTDQQVESLAEGFKANEKITVGGITVHIGTSEKGPQSIIFSKNNLLVLIKSSAQLDNNQWAEYINSLQ